MNERRRLAELEARARARHEAELKRLQEEEEEEARRLEAERLRAEAARRAQLEAEEEEAAEPEDPLAAERASLDEYDLGLYEIFNALTATKRQEATAAVSATDAVANCGQWHFTRRRQRDGARLV